MGTSFPLKYSSTHDINFLDVFEEQMKKAFCNEIGTKERRQTRFSGSATDKRSQYQNGASSVACMLMFIVFESYLRREFYLNRDKRLAHTLTPWQIYQFGFDDAGKYKEYFDELELVRNIIVHGYYFEGMLLRNSEWGFMAFEEEVISGKHRDKVKRVSKHLGLHNSPGMMSFMDIAKYYTGCIYLLQVKGLGMSRQLWTPPDGFDWDDLYDDEWLDRAIGMLGYDKDHHWANIRRLVMDEMDRFD